MLAFGAELTIVPSRGGKVTPDLIPRMMEKAKEFWSRYQSTQSLDGLAVAAERLSDFTQAVSN
jgi:hypothetical protein